MTVVVLVMAMPVITVMVIVVMVVIMIVVMRMIAVSMMFMPVIAMRMLVMLVAPVGVAVRGGLGIGAAFRIERRFDLDDAGPQPLHHCLDDVVAPDAQGLGHDLGRQMAVAKMPGDPDQMMRIRTLDLDQRLGRRNHLDQPAILQHQRVTAAQRDRIFEIEQEGQSARAGHSHAPPVAVVEIEHDRVG